MLHLSRRIICFEELSFPQTVLFHLTKVERGLYCEGYGNFYTNKDRSIKIYFFLLQQVLLVPKVYSEVGTLTPTSRNWRWGEENF